MDSPLPTKLDETQLDSLRDWSYPLLVAQNSIRIACNSLALSRVCPGMTDSKRREAETLLMEAKVAITDALAAIREPAKGRR